MPKISIVIPVHNVQDYLRECLDSVVHQTLGDIEAVCVDDNSDDASASILERYAQTDPRIRVITFPESRSASQARKDGALASRGEYIMFLDADDALELDACEKLHAVVQRNPVDIVHFGATITNEANLESTRIAWMEKFVRPYDGALEGSHIFEGCFSGRLYNFSIWGKLFSADLCRRSFAHVKDGSFPKAQDLYAYFILSYFARSYVGMPNEVFYHYRFGRGVTGHNVLPFSHFERYCSMGLVADAIRTFLVEQGTLERYDELYRGVRNRLLQDCVGNWGRHLGAHERAAGFDLMLEYWDASEVVAKIAELNWNRQGHIARDVHGSRTVARVPRPVRVVGTYYHRLANGGVQRVLSALIGLWLELGYEVVVFTDLPASEDDYDVPEGVQRVVLPSYFEIGHKDYVDRACEIERLIRHYGIDVVVYHAWVSRILLWDLLLFKAAGVAFVVHCHNVFSMPSRRGGTYFADMPFIYRLCDTVVALGDVDRTYWSNFNDNVVSVNNPLTFEVNRIEVSRLAEKNVLWLGRISPEKRPYEALRIFRKVLDQEPDAKLYMVGGGPDTRYVEGLNALVSDLELQDAVVMCGFTKDVLPLYLQASVFLMTSEYEGYSLVLAESQSSGVPCVMYEMPYLTLTKSRKGFVGVELGDIDAAADAVVALLRDPEYRRSLGREARANIESLAGYDLAGAWRDVFGRLEQPATATQPDENTRAMWDVLLEHYRAGAVHRDSEVARLRRDLAAVRRARSRDLAAAKRMRSSWSFRIGHAIMAVPRKIRRVARSRGSVSE